MSAADQSPCEGRGTSSPSGRTKIGCRKKSSNKSDRREKHKNRLPYISKDSLEESEAKKSGGIDAKISSKNRVERGLHLAAPNNGTLNLVSDTLLSVVQKLNKVFVRRNSSYDKNRTKSRQKIKRIYVVKLSEKGESKSSYSHQRSIGGRSKQGEMKGTIHQEEELTAADEKGESFSEAAICSGAETTEQIEQRLTTESEDNSLLTSDVSNLWRRNAKRRKRISTQTGDCDLLKPIIPEFNYRILYRDKSPRRSRICNSGIAEVFQAMIDEMDSVERRKIGSRKKQLPKMKKKKRLDQILDDNESVVTSDYDIPPEMINDESIARLQVLIEHAKRRAKIMRSVERQSDQPIENKRQHVSQIRTILERNDTAGIEDISASSSIASGPICRICHSKNGVLTKPCKCRGSLAFVHIECLQVWLTEKETNSCELCNHVYKIIHTPRNCKLIPSLGFWYKFTATPHQRKALLMDVTLSVVLLPFLIFFAAFVRYYADEPYFDSDEIFDDEQGLAELGTKIALKVVLFLVLIGYLAGIVIRANNHFSAWMSWFVSKSVTVVLDEQPSDETLPTGR